MENYRMNQKRADSIDKIVVAIGFIAIILFFILACHGCANKTSVATAVKPIIQSPDQYATSGGNTYMTNVTMAGGGAVAGLMFLMIGVLGWKYLQSDKALHAVTSAVEGMGHPAKRASQYEAMNIGAEKYLRKKVKKWYSKSTASQSRKQTVK